MGHSNRYCVCFVWDKKRSVVRKLKLITSAMELNVLCERRRVWRLSECFIPLESESERMYYPIRKLPLLPKCTHGVPLMRIYYAADQTSTRISLTNLNFWIQSLFSWDFITKKTHGPHELGKCRTVHVNVEFCVNKGVKYLTGGSIESEISISFRQFRSWEVMSFQCNCKVFCNLNWTFENWIKTLLLTDGHLKGNKTLRYSKTLILKY